MLGVFLIKMFLLHDLNMFCFMGVVSSNCPVCVLHNAEAMLIFDPVTWISCERLKVTHGPSPVICHVCRKWVCPHSHSKPQADHHHLSLWAVSSGKKRLLTIKVSYPGGPQTWTEHIRQYSLENRTLLQLESNAELFLKLLGLRLSPLHSTIT